MKNQNIKTYLWDSSSRASNPGYLPISYIRALQYSDWPIYRRILFMLLWLGLAITVHWAFYILWFFSLGNIIVHFLAMHDVFLLGDTLPGIVVDETRGLVATGTNMTRMFSNYPVIAFFRVKLPANYRRNGTRVPIIASYGSKRDDVPFWDQLFPNSVLSGIRDETLIRQKLDSIPEEDWQKLQRQISQRNRPYFQGLYIADREDSNWATWPDTALDQKLGSWSGRIFPLLTLIFIVSMIRKILPGRK